jgi:hypothetical protein
LRKPVLPLIHPLLSPHQGIPRTIQSLLQSLNGRQKNVQFPGFDLLNGSRIYFHQFRELFLCDAARHTLTAHVCSERGKLRQFGFGAAFRHAPLGRGFFLPDTAQWGVICLSVKLHERKTMKRIILQMLVTMLACASASAQVNSGSNGSDGAFNPATNIVINMADHPTGIYHYTSVNISNGVTVTFIPNANNSPVVWLVQSDCTIAGDLSVSGADTTANVAGAKGGPGGWGGGNAALSPVALPGAGLGPGGGTIGTDANYYGGNASFATAGDRNTNQTASYYPQFPAGSIYGNIFELPSLEGLEVREGEILAAVAVAALS